MSENCVCCQESYKVWPSDLCDYCQDQCSYLFECLDE